MPDLVWTLIAFFLTILVLSYLLGDNPLYRIAIYLFVGTSAGILSVMVIYQVIIPRLVRPLIFGTPVERVLTGIPLALSLLLFAKLSPRFGKLGNLPMGLLVGCGAALMLTGAVTGTLITQVKDSFNVFQLQDPAILGVGSFTQLIVGLVLLIGIVTTLVYFQFGAPAQTGTQGTRPAWIEALATSGKGFIVITLAALFAGVFSASLAALIDRIDFIRTVIIQLLGSVL